MIDTDFFIKNKISLEEIAKKTDSKIIGIISDEFNDVASLKNANKTSISFYENRKYLKDLKVTKAGFIFCAPKDNSLVPKGAIILETKYPYFAYSKAASMIYSQRTDYSEINKIVGKNSKISSYSHIGNHVIIGSDCFIDDGVIIKDGVIIGDGVTIKANSVVSYGVHIGNKTVVDYCCVLEFAKIGQNCHIYSGVKIGQRGYGFALADMEVVDVPHFGIVEIGDFVDIGANTTIDRGVIENTEIGLHTKIDNLVQIGHNVKIGIGCSLVSQVGIAGSAKIGDFCKIMGQVGISGHITIGNNVTIMPKSGVSSNVKDCLVVSGVPAIDYSLWKKINIKAIVKAKKEV